MASNNLISHRLDKLRAYEEQGFNPYPDRFPPSHRCADVATLTSVSIDEQVHVCGRIRLIRIMGGATFMHIADESGQVQLYLQKQILGETAYANAKQLLDLADFIGVAGTVFRTRTGEITVRVSSYQLLAKALREPPEKFHGLKDEELCLRKRYLDIMTNPECHERFLQRSRIIHQLRNHLNANNFTEVETPILQPTASGANAQPFTTKHTALDRDFFMRIAPETYLKRLLVAGYERVFEIGKNFRNEGMDRSHLQEFTMLEYYAAWWNVWDNLDFCRRMLQEIISDVCGTLRISYADTELDFSGEWRTVEFQKLVLNDCGIDVLAYDQPNDLLEAAQQRGIDIGPVQRLSLGTILDRLYKVVSRPKLIQPTILVHHPAVLSPLARRNDDDPRVVDQFQLVVAGWEVVKAYSELVDPRLQRQTFNQQHEALSQGDTEAMMVDEAFLEAMEHGMPPNSGLGLGIDRLVALLTNQQNLKEVVLFPLGT